MPEQKQITSRVKNNGIGIYCIKNQNNKKLYIGQSRKLGDRVQQHISQLENGTHPNIELLEDYKKGDRFFIHTVLYAPSECLDGLQIYYILKWSTHIIGYNTRIGLLDSFDEAIKKMITPKQVEQIEQEELEKAYYTIKENDVYKNSALSTINYLMKKNKWTIDDLFFFYKTSRNYDNWLDKL